MQGNIIGLVLYCCCYRLPVGLQAAEYELLSRSIRAKKAVRCGRRCFLPYCSSHLHFGKNEGVAKSIFGRIMCHAVFNRPTGDLRWVGAIPNAKTSATRLRDFA